MSEAKQKVSTNNENRTAAKNTVAAAGTASQYSERIAELVAKRQQQRQHNNISTSRNSPADEQRTQVDKTTTGNQALLVDIRKDSRNVFSDSAYEALEELMTEALAEQLDAEKKVAAVRDDLEIAESALNVAMHRCNLARAEHSEKTKRLNAVKQEADKQQQNISQGLRPLLESLSANVALNTMDTAEFIDDVHEGLASDATSLSSLHVAIDQLNALNARRTEHGYAPLRLDVELLARAAISADHYGNGGNIVNPSSNSITQIVLMNTNDTMDGVYCRGASEFETVCALGEVRGSNGKTFQIPHDAVNMLPSEVMLKHPQVLGNSKILAYLALADDTATRIGIGCCSTSGAAGNGCTVILIGNGGSTYPTMSIEDFEMVLTLFENKIQDAADMVHVAEEEVRLAAEKYDAEKATLAAARKTVDTVNARLRVALAALARADNDVSDVATALSDVRINAGGVVA